MTVEQARVEYGHWGASVLIRTGRCGSDHTFGHPCDHCGRSSRLMDAASIALDTATARAISGSDTPGSGPTWSQRWRTVQQIRWSDALHRTLLASVAY
jgi:hypothetical protein